jgi:hypothetical protein
VADHPENAYKLAYDEAVRALQQQSVEVGQSAYACRDLALGGRYFYILPWRKGSGGASPDGVGLGCRFGLKRLIWSFRLASVLLSAEVIAWIIDIAARG